MFIITLLTNGAFCGIICTVKWNTLDDGLLSSSRFLVLLDKPLPSPFCGGLYGNQSVVGAIPTIPTRILILKGEAKMARKPMVTRSFKATDCSVLCLDIETKETKTITTTIYGNFDKREKLEAAIKKQVETPTVKAVTITIGDVYEQLLGMDEDSFIQSAEKLPPRNTNL